MNTSPTSSPDGVKVHRFYKWHLLILSVCFVALAGELGLCLLVMPWLSSWDMSYIPIHSPRLADIWMNWYFRGALSGLGLLNLYVAVVETGRIFRVWTGKPGR